MINNSTSRYIRQRTESQDSNRYLYTHVCRSIIHSSQKSLRAEWINKIWFITLTGYYSALRKEILTQVLNMQQIPTFLHRIMEVSTMVWETFLSATNQFHLFDQRIGRKYINTIVWHIYLFIFVLLYLLLSVSCLKSF